MNLHSKIMRRASPKSLIAEYESIADLFRGGIEKENTRLLPLIQALANCAKALENWKLYEEKSIKEQGPYVSPIIPGYIKKANEALSSLAGIVGKE